MFSGTALLKLNLKYFQSRLGHYCNIAGKLWIFAYFHVCCICVVLEVFTVTVKAQKLKFSCCSGVWKAFCVPDSTVSSLSVLLALSMMLLVFYFQLQSSVVIWNFSCKAMAVLEPLFFLSSALLSFDTVFVSDTLWHISKCFRNFMTS